MGVVRVSVCPNAAASKLKHRFGQGVERSCTQFIGHPIKQTHENIGAHKQVTSVRIADLTQCRLKGETLV